MYLDEAYPTYNEYETRIVDDFDKDFLKFAKGYTVNKWEFASMISNDILQRCGYFATMPENLTFVSGVNTENVNVLHTGAQATLPVSGYGLTPAACLHIYPMLQKEKKRNELITTCQKVYRYEHGSYEMGVRFWEFWVREFVAVGTEEYVQNFLEDFRNKALVYAKERYGEAYLRGATDLFFPSRENRIIQRMQKKNNLKQELIVSINQRDVACASFNYHKAHFSKLFNFDEDGSIVTGCVGFGLNRWLARYNFEPKLQK